MEEKETERMIFENEEEMAENNYFHFYFEIAICQYSNLRFSKANKPESFIWLWLMHKMANAIIDLVPGWHAVSVERCVIVAAELNREPSLHIFHLFSIIRGTKTHANTQSESESVPVSTHH